MLLLRFTISEFLTFSLYSNKPTWYILGCNNGDQTAGSGTGNDQGTCPEDTQVCHADGTCGKYILLLYLSVN